MGARFHDLSSGADIRARITILATGASSEPLKRFGVCHRLTPSAIAARVYLHVDPHALELMRNARGVSALRGAPLRTGASGTAFSRPGLLVVGDAAGFTCSCTGEGIGKAMESGILAADLVASGSLASAAAVERISSGYAWHVPRVFGAKFRAY